MLDPLILQRLEAEPRVLIALSGGGDSVALVHVLCEALGPRKLHALSVDHGLRPAAKAEAAQAIAAAHALGVNGAVATLRWPDGAPSGQASARRARYAALCDEARRIGARIVALAHTADDQAETVLMRLRRGANWPLLAGMRAFGAAPLWPEGRGLYIARPLLGVRRAALRAFLRAHNADWIEDPSNANTRFERVRARADLAAREAAGFDPTRLTHLAQRLRPRADALDASARTLIDSACTLDRVVTLALGAWRGPDQLRARALSILIAAAAGADREPGFAEAAALERRMMEASFSGATLGGARLTRAADTVCIGRDPGAVLGREGRPGLAPMLVAAGAQAVWDGRFLVRAGEADVEVRPAPGGDLAALVRQDALRPLDAAKDWADIRPLLAERVRHGLGPWP